jgi:glycosyltransferase involved in cell wall biosynthesis
MEIMPLVSVIIPTHNRESLILRSISSVLSQTFEDFELIVIDDGSTDGTETKVNTIRDKRLRFIRYENNKGATHARNIGIENASGKYIAFQDSDDQWLPEKLMKQVDLLETSPQEVGVCFTGYEWMIDGKKIYMPVKESDTTKAEGILSELFFLFVGTPTALTKKECLLRVGNFDERLPRLQEWELWIRMSQICSFRYINEPLVASYHQQGGITASYDLLAKSFDVIYEKHRHFFDSHRKSLAGILAIFGRHLLNAESTYAIGKDYILKSLALNPLRMKYVFNFLLSLFGYKRLQKIRKLYRSLKSPGTEED